MGPGDAGAARRRSGRNPALRVNRGVRGCHGPHPALIVKNICS
ncbi:hypothetical protein SGPA1_40309 [Streptomyces misionensis JCM 4497]